MRTEMTPATRAEISRLEERIQPLDPRKLAAAIADLVPGLHTGVRGKSVRRGVMERGRR